MKGTPRTLTAALAGLITLGLVGACTDDAPDEDKKGTSDGSRTSVEMTEVKGTTALRTGTEVVGDWDVVVKGKDSAIVSEIAGSDGSPSELTAVDPRTSTREPLDVTAPIDWHATADGSRAVVAGDRTSKEGRSLFVRVSEDLTSWTSHELSYPGRGWSFQSVGLDGETPVVIAQKPDGSTAALRPDGDDTAVSDLPHTPGQETSGIELLTHGDQLVYLRGEGPRGGEGITRAVTSDDGGRTWSRGERLPGAAGSYGVAGAVSTGSHLVVTGWADQEGALGTTGMTWSSTNARSWARERSTPVSWGDDLDTRADFTLSRPSLVGGKAAFDQTCDTCRWTTRVVQDGGGKPQPKMNQTDIDAAGPQSRALPGRVGTGVRWEQGSLLYHSGKYSRPAVDGEIPSSLSDLNRIDGATLASVQRERFTVHEGGWTHTVQLTPHVLGSTLERKDWRPRALSTWTGVSTATDADSGTSVAAGTAPSQGRFTVDARVVSGGKWRTARGLRRHEYESISDVTHVGGRFLMGVQVATDGATATRTARVYSSTDGVRWTEERGTWSSDEDSASSVGTICELGDGTPFAVGTSQPEADGSDEATTWTREDGRWKMATLSDQGNGATLSSCATTGDTTVITGQLDGRDVEWTTEDGKSFSAGKPLARGVSRATAHEVDGGLVAAGRLDTKDHVGPVVWFSTDGTTWQWAPVEVDDNSATVSVLTADDDVYAVTSQDSGDRLWTIDEIATTKVTGDEG